MILLYKYKQNTIKHFIWFNKYVWEIPRACYKYMWMHTSTTTLIILVEQTYVKSGHPKKHPTLDTLDKANSSFRTSSVTWVNTGHQPPCMYKKHWLYWIFPHSVTDCNFCWLNGFPEFECVAHSWPLLITQATWQEVTFLETLTVWLGLIKITLIF